MVKCILFFLTLSLVGFGQKGDTISANAKPPKNKVNYEINISRKQLLEANTIRDLIPGMPSDCKIGECNIVYSSETGRLFTGRSVNGTDIQKCYDCAKVDKALYVDIKNSCKEYRSFKLVVVK